LREREATAEAPKSNPEIQAPVISSPAVADLPSKESPPISPASVPEKEPAADPNLAAKVAEANEKKFAAVLKSLFSPLQHNQFSEAEKLLDQSMHDPDCAGILPRLKKEKADIADIQALRNRAMQALRGRAGTAISLKKGALKGTVKAEPNQDGVSIVLAEGPELLVSTSQLDVDDVCNLLPLENGANKADELRLRGLLFMAAGDALRAEDSFTKAREAGLGDAVTPYLDRLGDIKREARETAAADTWTKAEGLFVSKSWKAARQMYETLQRDYAGSAAATTNADTLTRRMDAIDLALGPAAALERYFGPQSDWPRFRGPTGDGVTHERGLPTKWSSKENVAWSVDLFQPRASFPLHPFASPIVYKDNIFVVLAKFKDSIFVAPPKDLALKSAKVTTFSECIDCRLNCISKIDGKLKWSTALEPGPETECFVPHERDDVESPTAATPCTDGERVYVSISGHLGNGAMLAAIDFQGKLVWKQELRKNIPKGWLSGGTLSASPILYKDFVIMFTDGMGGHGHRIAYDRRTGEVRYCESYVQRDNYASGAASPVPVLLKSSPMLIYSACNFLQCVSPQDGKTLWTAQQPGGNSMCTSAVAGGDVIFCDTVLDPDHKWHGIALPIDVLPDAKGDVTKFLKWKPPELTIGQWIWEMSSPVICKGYLYRIMSRNVVCLELATGKLMYNEPLPGVSKVASPIATQDGLIYFISSGKSFVLKGGPTFDLIATNDLNDVQFVGYHTYGYTYSANQYYEYSSPAVSDGKIIIQGHTKLWCIGR
jgi:outer membrane protein assembly factor BamB